MIDLADELLHRVLKKGVADLGHGAPPTVDDEQIVFRPPDESWRGSMSSLGTRNSLVVYLVDLRENRKLRSNEFVQESNGHEHFRHAAPARIDCHYLITAWSNADEDHGRTVEEHRLLYQAAAALFTSRPLIAREVFAPDVLPTGYPDAIADTELPLTVLPVDGFPRLPEFWGHMGARYHWKPGVYAVLTVPVVFEPEFTGPAVTTLFGEYRPSFGGAGAETVVDVGGLVLDGAGAAVAGAWVRLESSTGDLLQSATSDADGRFVFTRIPARPYVFRAGAVGVGADERTLDVPSPSGNYDLHLHT